MSVFWARRAGVSEIALYVGAYVVYVATKGLVHNDTRATGLDNGGRIVSFQHDLGFLWEPGWQAWTIAHAKAVVVLLNWAYVITYWPVILTAALVLYVLNRHRYYFYRTVVLVNLVAALLVFMVFPVASPFAIPSAGLIDTIQAYGPKFYGSPGMATFYNISAAMPSLHFSWTVILGVFFWTTLRGWARAVGLVYPAFTLCAIVITGNHFITDAVAGGAMAAASFGVVLVLERTVWDRRSKT